MIDVVEEVGNCSVRFLQEQAFTSESEINVTLRLM